MPDSNCTNSLDHSLDHSLEQIKAALAPTHWNAARRDLLARFLVALLTAHTVCLYRLASLLPSEAKIESRYQRLRRFFGGFAFESRDLARVVLRLAQRAGATPPFVLAFDRTEWQLGKAPINVFVIGIVQNQVVFPLVWTLLEKEGSSDTAERIDLLQQSVDLLGKEQIRFVAGDREFISTGLLDWLSQNKIGFRLRLRQDILLTDESGELAQAGWFFRRVPLDKEQSLAGKRQCLGQQVFVSGTRFKNDKGKTEFLIIVSDEPAPLSDYGLRWSIENLFSGLKSRGFDLEATHLIEADRVSRLISVLAVAFAWAVATGEEVVQKRQSEGKQTLKAHGRRAKSALRHGLEMLRNLFAPLCGNYSQKDLQSALRVLYGT